MRQRVRLDAVGARELGDLGAVVEAGADHPAEQPREGEAVEPGALPVADRHDTDKGEIPRAAGRPEPRGQRLDERLRHRMPAARPADEHGVPVADQPRRLPEVDDSGHRARGELSGQSVERVASTSSPSMSMIFTPTVRPARPAGIS